MERERQIDSYVQIGQSRERTAGIFTHKWLFVDTGRMSLCVADFGANCRLESNFVSYLLV